MNKFIFLIFGIIIAGYTASANGGGVYAYSSVARSNDPVFRNIHDIYIISEKLDINLNGGYSDITVNYVLWNKSDKDYNDVDYGFPVDYIKAIEYSESFDWKESYIKFLEFKLNDSLLASINSDEKLLDNDIETPYQQGRLYRKWFYTKFSVRRNSFINLQVKYSIENQHMEDGDSPLHHSIQDYKPYYRIQYDFSPASHWGDGIIRDFSVTVDASDLILSGDVGKTNLWKSITGGEDTEQWGLQLTGLDFNENDGIYKYQTRNFNLENANPLKIEYNALSPSSMSMLKYLFDKSDYTVTSSSSLKAYPITNLTDMNFETTWVGQGENDWIEFEFKKSRYISGFLFLNGHYKNENTFYNNNRIKKIKIEAETQNGWCSNIIDYPDIPYEEVSFSNLFNTTQYFDFYEFFKAIINNGEKTYQTILSDVKATRLRFTILEVYKGNKYNDTCISEILLLK